MLCGAKRESSKDRLLAPILPRASAFDPVRGRGHSGLCIHITSFSFNWAVPIVGMTPLGLNRKTGGGLDINGNISVETQK